MSDFELMINVAREINFLGLLPAKTLGKQISSLTLDDFDPCNNPLDAWPVIVEFDITVRGGGVAYVDRNHFDVPIYVTRNRNPLRAAMICFLKMKDNEQ
jgi:hypothetical protein